jgi:hypothetical protein
VNEKVNRRQFAAGLGDAGLHALRVADPRKLEIDYTFRT